MAKWGTPERPTEDANCGTCELRSSCRDPKKSKRYLCSAYLEQYGRGADPSDRAFARYMQRLANEQTVVFDPFQIDDGDAPLAPNFYSWATGREYLNPDPFPYPKQMQLGIKLFSDACPRCSDPEWYEDIPHDCDVGEIGERLVFYEHGVCPKCKTSRLASLRKKDERYVNELIGIVGQRCLTGDARITTTRGLMRLDDLAASAPRGWSQLGPDEIVVALPDGSSAAADGLFVSEPEATLRVTLFSGLTLTGTREHPVMTTRGWVKLSELSDGDEVVRSLGLRVSGPYSGTLDLSRARAWSAVRDAVPSEVFASSIEEQVRALTAVFADDDVFSRRSVPCRSSRMAQDLLTLAANVGVRLVARSGRVSVIGGQSLLQALHAASSEPTTFNDPVVTVAPGPVAVTYDLRVPTHHQFVAESVVSHNSGKCLDGSSRVATMRGRVPIRSVHVGDYVAVSGSGWHRVDDVIRSPGRPMIRLTTELGFTLTSTHDHRYLTPGGWVTADRAKVVLVEAAAVFPKPTLRARLESRNWLARLGDMTTKEATYTLADQTRDAQAQFIRLATRVITTTGLPAFSYQSAHVARAVQEALLSFGVVAERRGAVVAIPRQYLRAFTRNVGYDDRAVAAAAALVARARLDRLDAFSQDLLLEYVKATPVANPNYVPPGVIQEWTTVVNNLKNRVATKRDLVRFVRLLNPKQPLIFLNDRFIQQAVASAARVLLAGQSVWTRVVNRERAGRRDCWDISVPTIRCFSAGGLRVHNSASLSFLFSYHDHRLLKLKNPNAFYGIKAGTILETTFVGIQFGSVKRYVFDPYLATIQDSPWFTNYHAILDDAARKRGEESLYRLMDSFIFWRHTSMRSAPASPSRRSLRGATRVKMAMDEISHFSADDKKVNISGLEVWRAMSRSLQTARNKVFALMRKGVNDVPAAISAAISSPYEAADPGMILYNKPTPYTYALKLPTWKFNPEYTFKSLASEFARDPVSAWRDFGARPPLSAVAFVAGAKSFGACVKQSEAPAFSTKHTVVRSRASQQTMRAMRLKWNWVDDEVPKVLALDAGKMKNSYAGCVLHLNEDGSSVYDAFFEIIPRPGFPVSFHAAERFVLRPIIERLGIKLVAADRWQSFALLERLEETADVHVLNYTLKYGDFLAWRELLYSGGLEFPRTEMPPKRILRPQGSVETLFEDKPCAALVWQSVSVIDVPGKTVDKPTAGNDDVFRAAVLAHAVTAIPEVRGLLEEGNLSKAGTGVIGAVTTAGGDSAVARAAGYEDDVDGDEERRVVALSSSATFRAQKPRVLAPSRVLGVTGPRR